jgi:transcriptional regulator with XRE-family HTH domain
MNFADLQERLRLELVRRIEADALTGSRLAQQTGFRQAHISNFLNRKRALSLEGLDRVLAAQNLTIDQILPSTITLDASASAPDTLSESVPLVSSSAAMDEATIQTTSIIEHIPVSAPLLYENRARSSPGQLRWQRFVAIRADTQQASAMHPLIAPNSIIIIDRHYTSLALYRSQQPNFYAARCGSTLQLGFASFDDGRLILRPNSTAFPVQLIPTPHGKSPSDLIVGRVCLVFNEL